MTSVLVILLVSFLGIPKQSISVARDFEITLKDVNAKQLLIAVNAPELVRRYIDGRIGEIKISVKDDNFTILCTKFRLQADPISRIEARGNLKENTLAIKMYALGGLVEYNGKIPKQVMTSLPMRLIKRN